MQWFDTNESEEAQSFIGPKYCSFNGRLLYYWAQTGAWGGVPKRPLVCLPKPITQVFLWLPCKPHREVGTRRLITRVHAAARRVEGDTESGVARMMNQPSYSGHLSGDLIQYTNGVVKGWCIHADYAGRPGDLPLTQNGCSHQLPSLHLPGENS